MEKFIVCSLYTFSVKIDGKKHKFFFENQNDARIARFLVYKSFDGERISTRNFVPPLTMVKNIFIREDEIKDLHIIKDCDDFEQVWKKLTSKEFNISL